jgi:hypothetical protein
MGFDAIVVALSTEPVRKDGQRGNDQDDELGAHVAWSLPQFC